MKKLLIFIILILPTYAFAKNDVDKHVSKKANEITVNVSALAKDFNPNKSINNSYTSKGNSVSITINKNLGIIISCKPEKNNIVKGTVIRNKESKKIQNFTCGGNIDLSKVDKPSANITFLAYNSLYKYDVGDKIIEDFVYRRANDNQDPNLKLVRYEKDDGVKDTLVSYKEIIVIIEPSAIEKFK